MTPRKLIALSLLALTACGSSQPSRTVAAPPPGVAEAPPPAAPTPPMAAEEETLPLDGRIRKTVLKNGLTVYVMPNKKPEQRAQLWLAVNAGSVLEDDDQQGLAHFVEHMAFNGTRRFEKQAIVNFIETVGMTFGADVNAYTSFDQTVYMLTVPTNDKKLVATGLDILRDWAGDVTFDPTEVDKERGVVMEEWRLGRGAFDRIWDKQRPVMFAGSRYATRSPIGIPEVLKNAPRDTLVRFYKEWYRPEHMAVIAVGDFDADTMEKEIASRFTGFTPEGKGKTRTPIPVPHDQPTAVTIASDPELPFSQVAVIDKMDRRREDRKSDYRRSLVEGLYHSMVSNRFQELTQDPGSPFTWAGSGTSSLTRTADSFSRYGGAKAGRTADTLTALVREIERVEQHGFSKSELDRVLADLMTSRETNAAEWDKSPSDELADEMTRNFFEAETMPGPKGELALTKELAPGVTLAELNHLAATWGNEKGRVIAISGPANAKLPFEAEVRALFASASKAPVEAWKDSTARPLMTTLPAPGKVTATTRDEAAGATVWTLSNNIKVVVRPTTFQNDAIEIQAWKKGGASLVSDVLHSRFMTDIVTSAGVADFDRVALDKALAGKVANVYLSMDDTSENISANTRPADLETTLQLVNLRLTAPRKDERAFAAWKAEQLEWVKNKRLYPEIAFNEDMSALATKNHPRRTPVTPEMINKVDLKKAHDVFKQRMTNFAGMTFVIVGNVDLATLQPLVERYLGSLPSKGTGKETWKDPRITYAAGKVSKDFQLGTEPKAYVNLRFSAADKWSRESAADAQVLSMVLRIRLREVLREDMGGVYGVRSYVGIDREPTVRRTAVISFGCDPANVDKLKAAALGVIKEVATTGASAENLAKVTEQLKRARETDIQENGWWSSQIGEAYWYGEGFARVIDLDAVLARVTSDNMKAAAKRFFDDRNVVLGIMRPKAVAPSAAAPAKP